MKFNYIVTIHQSEEHLAKVLDALHECRGINSDVYYVLDGCTDRSSEIAHRYSGEFIVLDDVRETLSINAALEQMKPADYTIILQDDVLLQDPLIQDRIVKIYEKFPNIGVLSFRHGNNFKKGFLRPGNMDMEDDKIQTIHQPHMPWPIMQDGFITERQVTFKSPICLSRKVIETLGGYDKRFAPIGYDDYEYCVRAFKEGFHNYVYALKVEQPLTWGGSRRFAIVGHRDYEIAHMKLLKELYPQELEYLIDNHPSLEQWKI